MMAPIFFVFWQSSRHTISSGIATEISNVNINCYCDNLSDKYVVGQISKTGNTF